MLSWMQVNLCQLYWINLLLMFQLPLRPCWLYSDNIIHSISIFNSKGRGQGFPVRDINTGNATGFTFMQVLLVTIHLTQCNGLRNVFFLVFFYVCWIVMLAKMNNRLIMILTVRQTSKEAKDKARPKHFCDLHCEREDDSQYWLKQELIGFQINHDRQHNHPLCVHLALSFTFITVIFLLVYV